MGQKASKDSRIKKYEDKDLTIHILSRKGEEYRYNFEAGNIIEPHTGAFNRWREGPIHEAYTFIEACNHIPYLDFTPMVIKVKMTNEGAEFINSTLVRRPENEITHLILEAIANRNIFFEAKK